MGGKAELSILSFMKPLRGKAYGSIPHLIGSKLGPGDHHVHEGQHKICTEKLRDKKDRLLVQEKYDGTNVSVAKIHGEIVPLVRRGYTAESSPFKQHHIFAEWVKRQNTMFQCLLDDGDRLCGEWLLVAHGLRYAFGSGQIPFVAFDYFRANKRIVFAEFLEKAAQFDITTPRLIHAGENALPIELGLNILFNDHSHHIKSSGCLPEGLVYRIERGERVDFLAKYVRADFEPGKYFPEISGGEVVYNISPSLIYNC